ncbi:hypothetical protein E3T25_11370 [Cryobacterium sandaracinum]|uniref:Nuclease SbcCD subunit C n=1 Tax=Cryobacterium sandaracinum TaxID=1259247 RepID=A0ABY2J979_9MICO|nr:AAA family ATPase [Cryobacterium sandaracinum]TFD01400.1 hypothetical protein E3T25_11370 [Cryobacterium sandaracinum]
MLSLRQLTVEDFGPFKGPQTISFQSERGVYIVYGPNGRGKTTLHNAFRFALYGEIRGRSGVKPTADIANTEARKERGYASFKTVLEFTSGDEYRLTRSFNETVQPMERLILERNGIPLSQDESTQILATVAPASVSQFFLFDGELLRQYENLLDTESEEGATLQDAIERVLGIPIVSNALADLRDVLRQAERQIADQYAADGTTKRMGLALAEAQDIEAELSEARDSINLRVHETQERIVEIEESLKSEAKAQRLIGRIDELRLRERPLVEREQEIVEGLRQVTPTLWRGILSERVSQISTTLQEDFEKAQHAVFEASAATRDLAHLRNHSDCPTCAQFTAEPLRLLLLEQLEPLASNSSRERADEKLAGARQRVQVIGELALHDMALVVERDKALRQCKLDQRALGDDIVDIEEQLSSIDEDELRLLTSERDTKITYLRRDQGRLEANSADSDIQRQTITDLRKKLARESVKLDPLVESKSALAKQLADLFAKSIEAYRGYLRREVEQHASEIFRSLSSEADYVGLRITAQYGLEILDRDGDVVRARSAGYEHLVALSLIAALQDSAAVRGPVIMDYPFGRLDTANTANVVAALPKMARQVILLAFDGEFDRNAARLALGSDLVAEFTLTRIGTKHTRIDARNAFNG